MNTENIKTTTKPFYRKGAKDAKKITNDIKVKITPLIFKEGCPKGGVVDIVSDSRKVAKAQRKPRKARRGKASHFEAVSQL